MASAPRPYPYDSLPRLSRRQVRELMGLRRRLPSCDASTALATARRLLGADCSVELGLPDLYPSLPQAPQVVAFLTGSAGPWPYRLAMPRPFAHVLADRMLGGDGTAPPPHTPLSPYAMGALAYLFARLLGNLQVDLVLRDLHEDGSPADRRAESGRCCVALKVQVGSLREWLWLTVPGQSPERDPQPRSVSLPLLPLTLVTVVGDGSLPLSSLRHLACDDVLIPERCTVRPAADGFTGKVRMVLAGSRRTLFECHASGHQLALGELEGSEEQPMSQGQRSDEGGLQRLVGRSPDAPIELTLELARYTLPLAEVASLQAGDVFSTGSPIGSRITLRASGVAIADGELVDVDGEIGIRILEVRG